MMTRRSLRLLIPVLLVLAGTLVAGSAQAAPQLAAKAVLAPDDDHAVDEPGNGLTVCNGGAQESSLVRMNDLPANLVENGVFAPLTGAAIAFTTPANDTDQIMVTFSAEARLLGQPLTYAVPADFVQVRVLLDGAQMMPANDLTFTTDTGQANATEACKRTAAAAVAVVHTVTVEWMIVDQGANNLLTGTIDDWTLHVEINN